MAKLRLVVEMEVPGDPDPGPPTRMGTGLARVKSEVARGNTAGEFEGRFSYAQGGEPTSDRVVYTWKLERA